MAQSPRKKSGPTAIGELLKDFIQDAMPKTVGEEILVFGAWPNAVGNEISRQAHPKSFKNGILFVETRHPIWTTELTSKRHLIRKKINDSIGKETVKEILFRLARY